MAEKIKGGDGGVTSQMKKNQDRGYGVSKIHQTTQKDIHLKIRVALSCKSYLETRLSYWMSFYN